jgi:hypothetical protein
MPQQNPGINQGPVPQPQQNPGINQDHNGQ